MTDCTSDDSSDCTFSISSPNSSPINGTIATEPIWVDSDLELAHLCEHWSRQQAIAVDTEFMRSQTFFPMAGLVQIGDGVGCYLIDPTAIGDFKPLADLMTNPKVTKVLHSCSEDIEVFLRLLGVVPAPLFDTQLAAAFAGFDFSMGYAKLLQVLLTIDIPKSETRSDWLQRPLSPSQLSYAALDVAYLLVVYDKLVQMLKANNRLDWVLDDNRELVANFTQPDSIDHYYVRVRLAWKLNREELAVLKSLCHWREQKARDKDIPRNHLVKERALWEMSHRKPDTLVQLHQIDDISARQIRQYGETLLALITAAKQTSVDQCPARLPMPFPLTQRGLLKALKLSVRHKAEAIGLPAEVMVRKKDLDFIVRSGMNNDSYSLPDRLHGWRQAVIGDELLTVAAQFT